MIFLIVLTGAPVGQERLALILIVYYADDTVLLATNTYAANRILWAVERISKQFGLLLNRGKCSYIYI